MAAEMLLIVEVIRYPSNELGIRGIQMINMFEVRREAITTQQRLAVDIIIARSECHWVHHANTKRGLIERRGLLEGMEDTHGNCGTKGPLRLRLFGLQ